MTSKEELLQLTNYHLRHIYQTLFKKTAPSRWKKSQLVRALEGVPRHLLNSKDFPIFKVGDIVSGVNPGRGTLYFYNIVGFTANGWLQTEQLDSFNTNIVISSIEGPRVVFRKSKNCSYKNKDIEILSKKHTDLKEYFGY